MISDRTFNLLCITTFSLSAILIALTAAMIADEVKVIMAGAA
jgi:hypothetical protein